MDFSLNFTASFTGIAYLLGFLAIGLLGHRFFQHWQKEKTIVSKMFFYLFSLFSLFMLIMAIVGLFFAKNPLAIKWLINIAVLIQNIGLATAAYIVIYLKLPRISPWLGFGTVFLLGLIPVFLIAVTPFTPYLEQSGGINWGVEALVPLIGIIRSFLFLAVLLPLTLILIQEIKSSQDYFIKIKAFGISVIIIFGIIIGLFDFILEPNLNLPAVSSDIALSILSFFAFIFILTTRKKTDKGLSKNYEKT